MIDKTMLDQFKTRYHENPANRAVESSIARVGIQEASLNNDVLRRHNHVFNHTTKRGDMTAQKISGRCWMFAALNAARVNTMEQYNIKTLEFSQVYPLFWDKLERANYFFNAIIETAQEDKTSRIVSHLLHDPLCDGGQWDMFKGILKKYGAVPKDHMPETFNSSDTRVLDSVLTSMLRRFAYELRQACADSEAAAEALKTVMLEKIYNILVKALGEVPEEVNFEFYDTDDTYHRLEPMTPQAFFKQAVGWNLEDKISILNAPTDDKPIGQAFTVKYLGSIAEADPIRHINVPIEVLKQAAIDSIKDGEPVWFGCDVAQHSHGKLGIMDMDVFNYQETLGFMPEWSKALRLDYGESLLTHAMVLTGVNLDREGNAVNWQVENSWGEKVGKKGMYSMSDEWFDVFVYQIMTDKKYLSSEWLEKYHGELVELAPWDPMGALAL